jgi:hypothetical protein
MPNAGAFRSKRTPDSKDTRIPDEDPAYIRHLEQQAEDEYYMSLYEHGLEPM